MTTRLDSLRIDYDAHAGRSIALPIAGLIVWTVIGVIGLFVTPHASRLVLIIGTGAIFPLGIAVARVLGEPLFTNPSPLAGLMGRSVVMINLLWALHVVLFVRAPEFLPLSLAIALGLHWVVFGWVIGHPVGLIHAVGRTALATGLWLLFPDHAVSAVAAGVAAAYVYSISVLATRDLSQHDGAAGNTDYFVRPYIDTDRESWLRCRLLGFFDSSYFDDVQTERPELADGSISLVTVHEGEVVGILDIESDGAAATIDCIAVHPDHGRRGIASTLLETALPMLVGRGVETLDAWTRDDEAANAWYVDHGFTVQHEYLHAYVEPYGDTTGFDAPVGKVVGAFVHAPIEQEDAIRVRYRRVHICRQYVRALESAAR